ncbi:LOW QUALITY PROTEIN: olfactory receptor 11A1-like [Echinops telfairi]|uniref:LOW QUALITY PROTEIN: olfactory receptor 11A1-like n=1 Tax=Echinops telfairi TaxID=9371 RepID=A0ABM1VMH1_ECHTE|nr:LOW QUALITY PROTEIN: olfactory receptor 11A1-like [Echinops telfairi]
MTNLITMSGFLLVTFSGNPEIEIYRVLFFLVFYLVVLTGNMLIITAISIDRSLHSPMYFLLKHLSFLDLCYITASIPRSICNSFMHSGSISLWECILQCFALTFSGCAEIAMLIVMSYDTYMAICFPLSYEIIMDTRTCVHGLLAAWTSGLMVIGFSHALMHSIMISNLNFCGSNHIHHFFCDVKPLLELACKKPQPAEVTTFLLSVIFLTIPFGLILTSYARILVAVLRVPAGASRRKAFSTCSSHLAVVSTFYGTLMVLYIAPSAVHSQLLSKIFALLYTVVTPILNPVIYTLRNRDVHQALWRLLYIKKHRDI